MNGKPRILITGGFGNLGSWLCEHFYNKGFHVTILANSVRELSGVRYSVIQADISNYLELKERVTAEFDYCIHTASYNEHFHENYAEKALLINTLGTRNIVEVLKQSNIKKFIYFSTFHVYGNSYDYIDEYCEPSPINDYASTHLFAEYYLKQFYHTNKFPSLVCRLTNSYGAPKSINTSKWYLVLNNLVKSAYEKGLIEIFSNGEVSRDFVWMGDVCQVTERLLFLETDMGTYNLSAGQNFKVIDLANVVQQVYRTRYNKEIEISVNQNDLSEYHEVIVDNKKLLNAIDYSFVNKLEGEVIKIFTLLEKADE